ncbi:MAG: hypothetical protein ABIR96_10110 [Bdellovibrionota bacterium]
MNTTFKIVAASFVFAAGFAFAADKTPSAPATTTAPVEVAPAAKKVSTKEAREACLKENMKLKGKALKKCIGEKRA